MGNASESPSGELIFVQSLQDRYFGQVQIYRSQEGIFVMKVTRSAISGDRRQMEQLQVMQDLRGLPFIVPTIHLKRTEEKGICMKYERVEIYTEYYNYTLADHMESRRELEEGELWLVLGWLLRLAIELRSRQMSCSLKLDSIFLTPGGRPCVYHYHLHSCGASVSYCELTMGQSIGKILMQLALGVRLKDGTEEELMREKVLFGRLAVKYKLLSNFVRQLITGTARQLITGTDLEQALIEQMQGLKEQELIHVADQVKLLKFKYHLPQNPPFLNIPTPLPKTPPMNALNKPAMNALNKPAEKENSQGKAHVLGKSTTNKHTHSHTLSQNDNSRKLLQTEQSHAHTQERRVSEMSSIQHNSNKNELSGSGKHQLMRTKEETSKMLGELDRKKEEYRLQRQKFELRKEELMRLGKENAAPQGRHQQRKSERRLEERRQVEHSRNGRFR